jgi:hypothetical protein
MHISIVEIGQNQRREGDPKWYGTCSITNYEYTKQTLLRLLGPASPRRSGGDDLVIMDENCHYAHLDGYRQCVTIFVAV